MAASPSESVLPLPASGAQPPALPHGSGLRSAGRSTAASRAQGRESGRILHLPPGPPGPSRRAMERAYAASCRAASAPVRATAASSAAAPAAPRRRTKRLKGGGDRDGGRGLGTSGSWNPALRQGKASGRTKKDDCRHCARPGPHSAARRPEEARQTDLLKVLRGIKHSPHHTVNVSTMPT